MPPPLYQKYRLLYRAYRYRYRHDAAEIGFMLDALKPGDTAIDIGAHKGAYTYWMAKAVGPAGRVLSIEPQPALADKLKRNLEAMALDHVTPFALALSDQPGRAELFIPGDGPSPGASLETEKAGDAGDTVTVARDTLDALLDQHAHGPVRFIKCDVEGHELAVFRGAEQTLRTHTPTLLFECETRHHADGRIDGVFDYLRALGYTGAFFLDGELKPLDAFDPAEHQRAGEAPYCNNFVFTPAG